MRQLTWLLLVLPMAAETHTVRASRYYNSFDHRNQVLALSKNTARLREPQSKVHKMEFATSTMLGCVGVAAPGVFGPTSAISGPYGGNMDYNRVAEGATVILPVYHPGGLLFMGDGHA